MSMETPRARWTHHACKRWNERFSELDRDEELLSAMLSGRIGGKNRKILRRMCPGHLRYLRPSFQGYYYRKSRSGVVFVIAPPLTIVTVLDLRSSALSAV